MNSRLDINVFVHPGCKLIATDNSLYTDEVLNHVFVEYLIYNEDTYIFDNSLKIREIKNIHDVLKNQYIYSLQKDGLFTYYKFVICDIYQFLDTGGTSFLIKDKVFYYNGNIYLGYNNILDLSELNDNSEIIYDLTKLIKLKDKNIPFYFDKSVITICNLQKCLVNLQKQILDIDIQNKCAKEKSSIKSKRDFILDSVFVLDYLIATEKYFEAQRIIDSLTSCNFICTNLDSNFNTDCNCGSSI